MITCKFSFKLLYFRVLLLVIGFFPLVGYSTSLGNAVKIPQSESLFSSSVYSNLLTQDTVTVTLNQQSYVTVMYNSRVIKTGCIGTMLSILSINGNQLADSEVSTGLGLNSSGANNINYTVLLAEGTHNFNVLHKVDGCDGRWLNRSLTVLVHT